MPNILNTGVSALNAFQRQLATTGHNISNANTEGYSRQRVDLAAREPEGSASGFIGRGVDVTQVRRVYDDFLADRVRNYSSSAQEFEIVHSRAAMIDGVIADPDAGISPLLQDFFNAMQDVADDPTSIPAREVLINNASILSDRFESLDNWFDNLRTQVNDDLENFVSSTNALADGIAGINQRILEVGSANGNNPPNDLLDQRDQLINELSQYVSVSTHAQDDGSINVFVGSGQALVVGRNASRFSVINSSVTAEEKDIVIQQAGNSATIITDQMNGGRLGGLLDFRDRVLNPTQNSLGLIAIGLGTYANDEHMTGMDLDGDLGEALFSVSAPQVLANPGNAGSVSVEFDDVADLNNREYALDFDGVSWTMRGIDNGQSVSLSGAGTVGSPFVAAGLSIVVGAGATAGDNYRIRPTRNGSQGLELLVRNPRDIAAADIVTTASSGTNAGTAQIGGGGLVTRSGTTQLAAPITLTFDAALNQFNLSSGGTLAYNPASDSGNTLSVSLAGLGDFEFTLNGTPASGDTFTLSDNTGGVGDNRNALRLAGIRDQSLLLGGTATIADTYGYMVADVGTRTSQAETNARVQSQLLSQAEEAHQEVSGVNLDEEAANLVRFQQAYQAAAQVINVANTLFDTLLGAVRR